MKNVVFFISAILFLASCEQTNESNSEEKDFQNEAMDEQNPTLQSILRPLQNCQIEAFENFTNELTNC